MQGCPCLHFGLVNEVEWKNLAKREPDENGMSEWLADAQAGADSIQDLAIVGRTHCRDR